ncbi:MAG: XRE family transcriptional regulator [Chloroflexota bacterium]|nr:XRE family transcriptional regulator [Chloroflexota bacterium]
MDTATAEARPRRRPAVGRRIRRRRQDLKQTLADVADATRLNIGYLSQIENEKASPSLETLAMLAEALDVPIAWFFLDMASAPRVVHAAERRRWSGPGGGEASQVDGGIPRELAILEVTSPAGMSTGLHSHPGDEHHLIVSGRIRFTQGEHVVEAGAGDYVLLDGTLPHDVETLGNEPARTLIVTIRGGHSELSLPPD